MHNSSRVILAAFADGAFAARKTKFIEDARKVDVFDDILFFNASQLPESFRSRHMPFIGSHPRGFGYWIWKPQVILSALERAGDNDLVVYLDAGCTLNPAGRGRFLEYLDVAAASPYKMLSFQNVHTEYRWTKADLVKRLGLDQASHIMNTSQLCATFVIMGKTQSNIDLVRQWQDLCVEDGYRYVDDSPSVHPNHSSFQEHRHDQSIGSLLRKLRGTTITHFESQPYDIHYEALKSKLPIWKTCSRK